MNMPTALVAEPRNRFLGPESDVRTGEDVLLIQPPGLTWRLTPVSAHEIAISFSEALTSPLLCQDKTPSN